MKQPIQEYLEDIILSSERGEISVMSFNLQNHTELDHGNQHEVRRIKNGKATVTIEIEYKD